MCLLRNTTMTGHGLMVLRVLSTLSLRSLALWIGLLLIGMLSICDMYCKKRMTYFCYIYFVKILLSQIALHVELLDLEWRIILLFFLFFLKGEDVVSKCIINFHTYKSKFTGFWEFASFFHQVGPSIWWPSWTFAYYVVVRPST